MRMFPSRVATHLKVLIVVSASILFPVDAMASRVALVIGNSAYKHTSPLANPRNDAEAIGAKLRVLGFETVEGYDLDMQEMSMKIRDFARASRNAEISVVFYAGHGMALNGENYLLPVDAQMQDETALQWELIPLSMITGQFNNESGAHILLLDACRDNPLAGKLAVATGNGTRSASSAGMAMVDVPNSGYGTGIAFATSPGAVAADGKGRHSPFTEALLTHLGAANKPIGSIMNSVKADVQAATDKVQIPWFQSSFTSDIVLNYQAQPVVAAPTVEQGTAVASAQPAAVPQVASDDEKTYWDFAKESNDAESYQLYLDMFPNGRFAPMARLSLNKLSKQPEAVQTASLSVQPSAPAGYAATPATRSLSPVGIHAPLALTPTDYLRQQPANQQTETLLQFGSSKYRERNKIVQARLTAAGFNVGSIDGAIGAGTRGQVKLWQAANGLVASGYFNMAQMQLLYSQSEDSYLTILSSGSGVSTSSGSGRKKNNGKGVGQAVNSFFHGLGTGIGLRGNR